MNFSILWETIKARFKNGHIFTKIIIVQCLVYALVLIFKLLSLFPFIPSSFFFSVLNNYLALPPTFASMGFKWYTLLSYTFIHLDFFHFISNIIVLFFFSQFISQFYTIKQSFPLYVMGGMASALFALLVALIKPIEMQVPIVGASGALMALMGAVTFLAPNYNFRFFGIYNVSLKYITGAIAVLNFLLLLISASTVSPAIHLGGILFGVGYAFLLNKGFDLSKPFNKLADKLSSLFMKRHHTITYKKNVTDVNAASQEYDMDEILDKISKLGYEGLSKAEKDFLFKKSGEL